MNKQSLELIMNNIAELLKSDLERIGVHYRMHSRIKEIGSLKEKINLKGEGYYSKEGRKIQDLFGFRITTYFEDDVKLLWAFFEKKYSGVGVFDVVKPEEFKPLRKNLTCNFLIAENEIFDEFKCEESIYELVDNTFEIQFRTTFSEGWHEVDHTLRYKCKDDWTDLIDESRMLNGFYALLETSDKALQGLFDDLSYHHYKNKHWEAMLRTKYRLKFNKFPLDIELCKILDLDNDLAKKIFRFNRNELISQVAHSRLHIPISYTNLIYLMNFLKLNDKRIYLLTPSFIKSDIEAAITNTQCKT